MKRGWRYYFGGGMVVMSVLMLMAGATAYHMGRVGNWAGLDPTWHELFVESMLVLIVGLLIKVPR